MKRIVMTKKGFPGSGYQCIDLPFTEKDLLRAVIAAGRNWRKRKKSVAEQADIEMRVNALSSTLSIQAA